MHCFTVLARESRKMKSLTSQYSLIICKKLHYHIALMSENHNYFIYYPTLYEQPIRCFPGPSFENQGINKLIEKGFHDDFDLLQDASPYKRNKDMINENLSIPSQSNHKALEGTGISKSMSEMNNENDVLFGRGKGCNDFIGNRRFRKIISYYRDLYINAKRPNKPLIAMKVVQTVRNSCPPGRFLKFDKNEKTWFDVGDKKACEKSAQALREGTLQSKLLIKERMKQGEKFSTDNNEIQGASRMKMVLIPKASLADAIVRDPSFFSVVTVS